MSDKYIFDEKEAFKPMVRPEFDCEKFYPKLMENYCIALSRIEELEDEVKQLHEEEEKEYNRSEDALVRAETAEDRVKELESQELGYIQSLRELEARVRELDWISVEDRLPEEYGPYLCVLDWGKSKEVKSLWRIDDAWFCHGHNYPEVIKWRPLPKAE